MTLATEDFLFGETFMHKHGVCDVSDVGTNYLKLDQTTPQIITGGSPIFSAGMYVPGYLFNDTDSATNGKFGDVYPMYIISNFPAFAMNAYFLGGWKFGAGSVGDYAGVVNFSPKTGDFVWQTSDAGNADAAATMTRRMRLTNAGRFAVGLDNPSYLTEVAGPVAGYGFVDTSPKTITRNGDGFITSKALTGRTITYTRDASNYITSKTDGIRTWTYPRNASNQITAVAVA